MINCENLSKIYSIGNEKIVALDNINLNIKKGEFVSVVGASGSGKSTLMNIIGALDTQTKGSCKINGREISKLSQDELSTLRSRYIGFVFQGFNLIPTLTAYENVELPLIYKKVPRAKRKKIVNKALKEVSMTERKNHLPTQLSGGQNQRVAIARALSLNPKIILADEPTGSLDVKTGNDILNLLIRFNKKGKTLIIVTHDMNVAKRADRQIEIIDGKI
ncbi:MAG: ABC transporter ATP-binding protein [Oscillospiraceae bacterium]|nr:ABC transporter ATP-binding protein [Oscillospiraceae bacterium]